MVAHMKGNPHYKKAKKLAKKGELDRARIELQFAAVFEQRLRNKMAYKTMRERYGAHVEGIATYFEGK